MASSALDEAIASSLDRARVYRGLAQLFRPPDEESLQQASERDLPELRDSLARLSEDAELLREAATLCELLDACAIERLRSGYHAAFDESSGSRCAPTEMDQLGGTPQLQLTRTFEMADVAGFYRAFGVEVEAAGERVDHIAAELEFMNLLAVKEAVALDEEGEGEHAETCRNASRSFLRDHLQRWAPRLGESLGESSADPVYRHAGRLLRGFVALDAEQIDAANAPQHRIPVERPGAGDPL